MAFKKEGASRFGARSGGSSRSFGRDGDKPSRFGSDREKQPFESRGRSFGSGGGGARFNGSKPSFGGKSNFELFDADCEKCGKECQVPFKPTNGKPVYCRDCFSKNDEFSSDRRSSSSSGGVSSEDIRELNKKLDKIMRALKID